MTANAHTRRKRILVLASTFPRWAGDREPPFVFHLSRRLSDVYDVTVLAPHAPGAARIETLDGINVRRFRYAPERLQRLAYNGGILANLKKNRINYLLVPLFVLGQMIAVVRLLRSAQFELIHAHWILPQGLIALVARTLVRSDAKILCTSHGGDLFGLSGRLLSRIKARVIRGLDSLTVVSQAMRDLAVMLSGRDEIAVIPMGVDLDGTFTPTSAERQVNSLLFAGRLVEKKGVDYLVRAMPQILRAYPDTRLSIAGDGPMRGELEALTDAIGISGNVEFLGSVDQQALCTLYRRASIFVAPSVVARGGDQEGLGLVFVEALGCECPVVATDLPAIRDVIIDGVTGRICRQKDEADLAEKIIGLLADSSLRASLARHGRQYVLERFNWENIAQRYKDTIATLLAGSAIRPEVIESETPACSRLGLERNQE